MRELLPYLLPLLTIIGSLGGFLYGKRRRKALNRLAEAKASNTELDGIERAISIWRGLAKEFQEEVEKLRSTVDEFREENEKLSLQNEKLSHEIEELRQEVLELRLENEKLKLEVKGLREELQLKKS